MVGPAATFLSLTTWLLWNRRSCGHSSSARLLPLQVSITLYNVVALISSVFLSFFRNSGAAGEFCLCGRFLYSGRGCLPCRCGSGPVNLPGRYNFLFLQNFDLLPNSGVTFSFPFSAMQPAEEESSGEENVGDYY